MTLKINLNTLHTKNNKACNIIAKLLRHSISLICYLPHNSCSYMTVQIVHVIANALWGYPRRTQNTQQLSTQRFNSASKFNNWTLTVNCWQSVFLQHNFIIKMGNCNWWHNQAVFTGFFEENLTHLINVHSKSSWFWNGPRDFISQLCLFLNIIHHFMYVINITMERKHQRWCNV